MKGKKAFIKRLFNVFINEEPKRVELIRAALKDQDTKQISFLTHSLKGSSATLGAEDLRECCLRLELAAKAENMEESATCFKNLEAEINGVYKFMQKFLDEFDELNKN